MDNKEIVLELLDLFCLLKDDRQAELVKYAASRLEEQADTIERLQKERDDALKQFSVDAAQAQNQIDTAAAQRVQVKDLQGRLWSVRESRDHARKQRDDLKERFDRLADHRARAENDLRVVERERDAALAEVERLKNLLNKPSDQAVEPDPWPVGGEIY